MRSQLGEEMDVGYGWVKESLVGHAIPPWVGRHFRSLPPLTSWKVG